MLSVVIPTHNRCKTLRKAIAFYQKQSAVREISELLVIDDGSTDSTRDVVFELSRNSAVPVRYVFQQNKGPAAARNAGIQEARTSLILFTDDDIIPSQELVAEHVNWHSRFPQEETAVLGYVTWSPDIGTTPFMQWYGLEALFAYAEIADKSEVDYRYFYTCNISLHKEFLRRNGGFDEDFKFAAWEDVDLGFRLNKVGLRLFYNPSAVAYHEQLISFEDACRRYKKSLVALETLKQKEVGRKSPQLIQGPSATMRRFKKCLAPLLSPCKGLMDWKFPLPWSIYRTMFRIYR